MMEEEFPVMYKMMKVVSRFSNKELRESFASDKLDESSDVLCVPGATFRRLTSPAKRERHHES